MRLLLLGLCIQGALLASSSADQIAAAVLAAPKDMRSGAAVLGYNEKGELVTLRKGENDLICLASDPKAEKFSVACYHKELEPYMARGRELIAQGLKGKERQEKRWKEVEEGKVAMPRGARTLYVLSGQGYDAAKGEITGGELRWVIYIPYATPESTGLSTTAGPGPWLMYPGTPGAHVMLSSPHI
jgi:hypothetical protein